MWGLGFRVWGLGLKLHSRLKVHTTTLLEPMFALKNVLPESMHFEFTLFLRLCFQRPKTKQQHVEACPLLYAKLGGFVLEFLLIGRRSPGVVRASFLCRSQEKFPAEV